jgi:DNA (cytosine-5)-methyltransferase 1
MTVREAIGKLKPLDPKGGVDSGDPMHKTSNHRDSTIQTLALIPKDGGARPRGVGPKCLDKVAGFYDVYGRLWWDRPAITITARCRTPSCGRFTHPEQNRGLSIREAALLQGFPKTFIFKGPFDDCYKQIGNAVPPPFSVVLAQHIKKILLKKTGASKSGTVAIDKPKFASYSVLIAHRKGRMKK